MKLDSAVVASRKRSFMSCRFVKSLHLVFYFVKNREDDFYLLFLSNALQETTLL